MDFGGLLDQGGQQLEVVSSPALHFNQMVQRMAKIKMLMLVNQMMQFKVETSQSISNRVLSCEKSRPPTRFWLVKKRSQRTVPLTS